MKESEGYGNIRLLFLNDVEDEPGHFRSWEVRIINNLPLMVIGKIITEGVLIFSRNEAIRVDFETSVLGVAQESYMIQEPHCA